MSADSRQLAWLVSYQGGILSRAQAISAGMTTAELRHRLRAGGPWRPLLPGVYSTSTGQPSWPQLVVAAVLYAGPGGIVTGLAALKHHDIRIPAVKKIVVVVPAARQRKDRDFVVVRRTRRLPLPVSCDGPVRYAMPARAVADAMLEMTTMPEARAVVATAVQRRKCTVPQLAAELSADPAHRAAWLRHILEEVAEGTRSVAEGDFRRLVLRSGLPRPLFNPTLLLDGQFLAVADAWWPQAGLVVEIDSREWHLSPEDWERTMQRHARMTAAGLRVLHVSPRQVRDEGADVVHLIAGAHRTGRPLRGITWQRAAA